MRQYPTASNSGQEVAIEACPSISQPRRVSKKGKASNTFRTSRTAVRTTGFHPRFFSSQLLFFGSNSVASCPKWSASGPGTRSSFVAPWVSSCRPAVKQLRKGSEVQQLRKQLACCSFVRTISFWDFAWILPCLYMLQDVLTCFTASARSSCESLCFPHSAGTTVVRLVAIPWVGCWAM